MTMYLRRRAVFSAGYLGTASGKPGGHNYICELCVSGQIDSATGMVVNITDIDAVLKSQVTHRLDGTLLDRDVPAFADSPPTPENIARYIWNACVDKLPPSCRLSGVTLFWKPTAWVSLSTLLDNREKIMLTVTRAYEFSASHRLHAGPLSVDENVALFGKCNWVHGHGHNYEFDVAITGEPDPKTGQILPPEILDRMVEQEILLPFDHRHLNLDVPEFADLNPTSENLTRVIWDRLYARWQRDGITAGRLYRVTVRETPRNHFDYYGPTLSPAEQHEDNPMKDVISFDPPRYL
jgi:6-pyruvoyltetrahydropterin/6-carboxytetrahydropterin synthase